VPRSPDQSEDQTGTMEVSAAGCYYNPAAGFGDLWVSSPMGSFESTYTPWEEFLGENFFSEITDAYGTFCEQYRDPEGTESGCPPGDHLRRHELHGRAGNCERPVAERIADPSCGLRLRSFDTLPLLQCDNPCADTQNLHD